MTESITGSAFAGIMLVLLFASYLVAAVGIAFGAKRIGGWLKKTR